MEEEKKENSILVGYDCPLGSYPAPLVPIICENDKYKAVYLDEDLQLHTHPVVSTNFSNLSDCEESIKKKLEKFDYCRHRLFAISESDIEFYEIKLEKSFFINLLSDDNFSENNPFVRVSLAEATGYNSLLRRELKNYEQYISKKSTWVDFWKEDKKVFEEKINAPHEIVIVVRVVVMSLVNVGIFYLINVTLTWKFVIILMIIGIYIVVEILLRKREEMTEKKCDSLLAESR